MSGLLGHGPDHGRRQLAALVLSDAERAELTSLAARRNTGQAPALRARIVLRAQPASRTSRSRLIYGSIRLLSGSGTDVLSSGAWMGRETSHAAHDR
jgi:hypothetical protein